MNTKVFPIIPLFRTTRDEIIQILKRCPPSYNKPLFVLNEDNQALSEYLNILKKENEINLFEIPFQVGKAEAIRCGLEFLLMKYSPSIILQLDSHLKQPPEETIELIKMLEDENLDMVVANRYKFQNLAKYEHRSHVSSFCSKALNELTGYELRDVLCGTRAYRKNLAEKFLHLRTFGYGLEVEQIIIAFLNHYKVGDAAIHSKPQDEATNAGKIEDNLYTLLVYANDLGMSNAARNLIHHILVMIKRRISFMVDLSELGINANTRFEYNNEFSIDRDNYSSGTSKDGYKIKT